METYTSLQWKCVNDTTGELYIVSFDTGFPNSPEGKDQGMQQGIFFFISLSFFNPSSSPPLPHHSFHYITTPSLRHRYYHHLHDIIISSLICICDDVALLGNIVTFKSVEARNYFVGRPYHYPYDPYHDAFKTYVAPLLAGIIVFDFTVLPL